MGIDGNCWIRFRLCTVYYALRSVYGIQYEVYIVLQVVRKMRYPRYWTLYWKIGSAREQGCVEQSASSINQKIDRFACAAAGSW